MNHEFKNKIKSRLYEQLANSLMERLVDDPREVTTKPTVPPTQTNPVIPIPTTPTKPIRKPKPKPKSVYGDIDVDMAPS